ncbi:MAG: 3-phosphoshikimate 1-carboxyvinyltransferase [Hyphomicrobiaceae bacterium]
MRCRLTQDDNSHAAALEPLRARRADAMTGRVRVPGDKSISHRALMFGGMATGSLRITGLLEAEDVLNTAAAMRAFGAVVERLDDGSWRVAGRGVGGLIQPAEPLDFGNAGTGTRLIMGVIAGHDMTVKLIGDASLSRRPMGRVLGPLRTMGLEVLDGDRETLPLTIRGSASLVPITYTLPVPSAQVKSAILIAGLMARGTTTVLEAEATRDHTERMLRYLGAEVVCEPRDNMTAITVSGDAELVGRDIIVPGDPSSAAFLIAAAVIVPGSDVTVEGVLINETRSGFYTTLREMGADVSFENARDEGGERVADIRARTSKLTGVAVPPKRAPSMIDEYPVLAVVAAFADGETRMQGLAELKVKESDRLAATADGLAANGVTARVEGDDLIVTGGATVTGGGTVATHLDHRIAMAFLTLGLATEKPVTVDDAGIIATSFKEFSDLMGTLGASFEAVAESTP